MSIIKIFITVVGLGLLAFLGYYMLLITLDYFPVADNVGFLRIKQWVFRKYPGNESNIWFVAFYIHVATSMIVLLAGFTQFFKFFYKNKIHRYMGIIYVLITLLFSAPSGFYMGIYANGGIWSKVSFISLSILWWGTTFIGYRLARKKKYDIHRKWMVISYALALSALTLRAWKFGITNWTDLNMKPMDLYRLVAWIGWVPNFVIALIIVLLIKRKMDYRIINPEDFKTTHWSGGTTTELYIYPEGADFKSKEFDFRLSIATINIEESDFTPLRGFDRTLLLLEGELELIHEGHHISKLKPLMQDSFNGGWQTKCIGTGKDFNLMTKSCSGSITVVKDNTVIDSNSKHTCIYALEGNGLINGIDLKENSLMVISDPDQITLNTTGIIIHIRID